MSESSLEDSERVANRQYWDRLSRLLVSDLTLILEIKGVTANTDLLGKYTEAAVRSLVNRIVHPMRVSTGAVIDYPLPDTLRQIDLIIWAPFPVPALFDVEGFGLVPRGSSFGTIEIKRSNYSGVAEKLEAFIADVVNLKIVSDPRGPMGDYTKQRIPGLGIICVLESVPSEQLDVLLTAKRAIAIFERKANGEVVVRHHDVWELVNFLQYVTWRYRVQSSLPGYPTIADHS